MKFINLTGYTLRPLVDPGMYQFESHHPNPIMWEEDDGSRWRPNRSFLTDGMSGGWLVSAIMHCTTFQYRGVFFHDSGYRSGGLWSVMGDALPDVFTKLSKLDLDYMLARQIRAEGATRWQAIKLVVGLQTPGGWLTWRRYRQQDAPASVAKKT